MPRLLCTSGGTTKLSRVAYRCETCSADVWQAPMDFFQVGAWPASMESDKLMTVVDEDLLRLYGSLKLDNPTLSLSGFLKAMGNYSGMVSYRSCIMAKWMVAYSML